MNQDFNELFEMIGSWPVAAQVAFAALAVISVVLQLWAILRVVMTPDDRLVFGKKWPWLLITLLANPFGSIVTLALARKPREAADPLGAGTGTQQARTARAADVLYGPREDDES